MQNPAKDKMQRAGATKDSPPFEDFHFAGAGDLPPITIRARTQEDAERQWRRIAGRSE